MEFNDKPLHTNKCPVFNKASHKYTQHLTLFSYLIYLTNKIVTYKLYFIY
jgi:hypothetical protein